MIRSKEATEILLRFRNLNPSYLSQLEMEEEEKRERRRERDREYQAQYRIEYPERIQARAAVRKAVRQGILPKVTEAACVVCGGPAQQYHHHKGYAPENWLEVIPSCNKHHHFLEVRS